MFIVSICFRDTGRVAMVVGSFETEPAAREWVSQYEGHYPERAMQVYQLVTPIIKSQPT